MTHRTHRLIRALHVIPSVSEVHGGPSTAMRVFEKALREVGVAVDTATTDDDGPGRHMALALGEPVIEDGGTRFYFRKWFDFYKVAPGLAWWVYRHARDYALLHIHGQFSFSSVAAALAARWHRVPYVVRPLGALKRYGLRQRRPILKRLSLTLFESRILRDAAAVHFTSEVEWIEAKALGIPMRGVVIPLGVGRLAPGDAEVLYQSNPEVRSSQLILLLSRLDPIKNVEALLRGFSQVAGRYNVRLLIAGSGLPQYVSQLKTLAAQLGVDGQVTWLGHIEGQKKAAAFAAAHVFVLPSFSENFGIAAAEALMAGLPCLLGQGVALASEVVAAGAGLAVRPDADSIAAGIERILTDSKLRDQMAVRARELASTHYSVEAMAERLVALYNSILLDKTS